MCSICGIYAPRGVDLYDYEAIPRMGASMKHRGPDATEEFRHHRVLLHHNRLTVVDPEGGNQPMTVTHKNRTYTVIYNGELYNTDELREELAKEGIAFHTRSDTEVLAYSYAVWGEACPKHLNGIFAFSVFDHQRETLFCARDPMGVKPFFFHRTPEKFVFASEIKALLAYGVQPILDAPGLWQLLYLSPITLPGSGVFRDIHSLLPGECCTVTPEGVKRHCFQTLEARPFLETEEEAIRHVQFLLEDAIKRQLVSDVPLATFLSGGLDSSIVSAVAAKAYGERGETLSTYSFEYEDNDYAPTLFQPQRDDEYAKEMAKYIGSDHRVLTATNRDVSCALDGATFSRDFPGQADIDSSLYFYMQEVKKRHTVALSGECADEIFGGYPWFYRPEMVGRDFFPWIHDPHARIGVFDPQKVLAKEGYSYLSHHYKEVVKNTPCLEGDTPEDRVARVATKLSVDYFMASLLERKDRMSMAHGVEVRVPFSDYRILSYVYNVPWNIKFRGGVEKALLRQAMGDYLPDFVKNRKKSPYPKTHNPGYEKAVLGMLKQRLAKSHSPLGELLKPGAISALETGGDVTWLGQLMARPQLYAWLYQFDLWLDTYKVTFSL